MVEPMYRPAEAAKLIGISEKDLRLAVKNGYLHVVMSGGGKIRPRYYITKDAIEKWQSNAQQVYHVEAGRELAKKARARWQDPPEGMEYDKNGKLRFKRKRD